MYVQGVKTVDAQDAPEDEPYVAVVFPDGSWLPLTKVLELCGNISIETGFPGIRTVYLAA